MAIRKHQVRAVKDRDNEMLTIAHAARVLGVGTRTLERWTEDGLVPVFRLPNGHRRFRRSEIESLLTRDNAAAYDKVAPTADGGGDDA